MAKQFIKFYRIKMAVALKRDVKAMKEKSSPPPFPSPLTVEAIIKVISANETLNGIYYVMNLNVEPFIHLKKQSNNLKKIFQKNIQYNLPLI